MELFKTAGENLERLWRARGYDEKVFPDLAAEVLADLRIPDAINAWEVIESLLSATELPEQRDLYSNFGDPPITLFTGPRFVIEVYYWLEGTTAIHQHSFCGAFQVFHGSSIHSQYKFETKRELNSFAKTGELSCESCKLLDIGDIQRIDPGSQYIHSLFHLDQPSATIVARTTWSKLDLPQFSYLKPGFAFDPFFESPIIVKKIQILSAAIRSNHAEADRYLEEYLRKNDFLTAFQTLQSLRPLLSKKSFEEVFGIDQAGDRFERNVGFVMEAHPELGELPRQIFAELKRTDSIVVLRNVISEPEHRFFLALLLNIDSIGDILLLVQERFPESDPKEKMLDWVSDLGNTRVIDGSSPNGLGIPKFTDFDTAVLEKLLDGKSGEEIAKTFQNESGGSDEVEEKVGLSVKRLRSSDLFKRLLQ